jgi:hypothetical protein
MYLLHFSINQGHATIFFLLKIHELIKLAKMELFSETCVVFNDQIWLLCRAPVAMCYIDPLLPILEKVQQVDYIQLIPKTLRSRGAPPDKKFLFFSFCATRPVSLCTPPSVSKETRMACHPLAAGMPIHPTRSGQKKSKKSANPADHSNCTPDFLCFSPFCLPSFTSFSTPNPF